MTTIKEKSEILFLYESTYSIPNGDPFTGEQRYDDESKKILVSDVRIKRYIRDYLFLQKDNKGERIYEIYVWNDKSQAEGNESGSAARMKALKKANPNKTSLELLKDCIDVRLFGGISTEEKDAVNLTGPIQFALLNPSLNQIELRMHQNTSVFVSSVEKSRGSIGTTTVVPYAVNQIHGWINPYSATETKLTDDDVKIMLEAMWNSINNANTRTKSNQNSLLLLQIVYSNPNKKLYGLDRLITLDTKEKKSEQLRSIEDYDFNIKKLIDIANSEAVSKILYHSEVQKISEELAGNPKFELMFNTKEGAK